MLQIVDVDVIQEWEEAETADAAEITAVCGSSFYSSAAAAAAEWEEAAAATTAVCGSSFFSCSAAETPSATDADVTANLN